MTKNTKRLIYLAAFLLFLTLSILWILHRIQEPPITDFQSARQAITKARKNNAELYSKIEFELSEQCYDSAMSYWRSQNERFILNRDYSYSKVYIKQSRTHAEKANANALKIRMDLKERLNFQIKDLKEQVSKYQAIFSKLPVPSEIVSKNSKGQLLLFEAESTYTRGRYKEIENQLIIAEEDIKNSYKFATKLLDEYFEQYPSWVKQAEQTRIKSEKSKSYALVIDKFSRECYVYYKGDIKYIFDVELGKNWLGNKNYSGDQATPEGMYHIVKKKLPNKTKYYKALLLNYPNDDDKQRFKIGKNNGTLQSSTKIGNLIEIHGEGGKGIDWTQGCVALHNKDMDVLFKLVDEDTPVTIVGSLKSLKEIMQEYGQQKD
ncbi:MAG: L,D-transpeptidase family protein [Salinivirgaceae bacterium]|nr:L,D-transpeptidase family protein [Salinivirgaceae bacterium]